MSSLALPAADAAEKNLLIVRSAAVSLSREQPAPKRSSRVEALLHPAGAARGKRRLQSILVDICGDEEEQEDGAGDGEDEKAPEDDECDDEDEWRAGMRAEDGGEEHGSEEEHERQHDEDDEKAPPAPRRTRPTASGTRQHKPLLLNSRRGAFSSSQRPTGHAAPSSSSSSSCRLVAPLQSSAYDWSVPLPGSPHRHVKDGGLFLMRSFHRTYLAYDDSDDVYQHVPYPPPPSSSSCLVLVPSVFAASIVQLGGEQWLYAKDALMEHRLQVHAGKLMAWKDGETRKDKRQRPRKTDRPQQAATSKHRVAHFAYHDEGSHSDGDDVRAEDGSSSAVASSLSELVDGQLLRCQHTPHARVFLFYAGQQPSCSFLSPRKQGKVTVRVKRPHKEEQWTLLPLSQSPLLSLPAAAVELARHRRQAELRQRAEERRQQEREWNALYPRELLAAQQQRVQAWRSSRAAEAEQSWLDCQDEEVRARLLDIVLTSALTADIGTAQPGGRGRRGDPERFCAAGVRERMCEMPERGWIAAAGIALHSDEGSGAGEDEDEPEGWDDCDCAAELRSEQKRLEEQWRRQQLDKHIHATADRKRLKKAGRSVVQQPQTPRPQQPPSPVAEPVDERESGSRTEQRADCQSEGSDESPMRRERTARGTRAASGSSRRQTRTTTAAVTALPEPKERRRLHRLIDADSKDGEAQRTAAAAVEDSAVGQAGAGSACGQQRQLAASAHGAGPRLRSEWSLLFEADLSAAFVERLRVQDEVDGQAECVQRSMT